MRVSVTRKIDGTEERTRRMEGERERKEIKKRENKEKIIRNSLPRTIDDIIMRRCNNHYSLSISHRV